MEPPAPASPGTPPAGRARPDADLAAVASLAEPTRRALYDYVRASAAAVSRDEAAAGVGVPRHAAKFHLDKLVSDGLLEAEYQRRTGRQGPGAGRPAKLYRPAPRDIAVALPARRYDLAGLLMARAITEAAGNSPLVTQALRDAAQDRGRLLAQEARRRAQPPDSPAALLAAVRAILDEEGYATRAAPAGLTLVNCPFRALSVDYPEVVCGMNLAIMDGLLRQLGRLQLAARPDPAQGRCCVRLDAV